MESKGTAKAEWLIDGRWMKTSSTGSMMGMDITGHGIMGYDNHRQKYVNVWVDSGSTMMLTSEGNYDQSRKNLVLYGKMDEAMTGEIAKQVKYAWRFQDADHFTMEIHDLAIGEENSRVVEIVHTRKK